MNARLIKTEADHEAALGRIDELMGAEPGTPEMDELELLVHLVETYEARVHPIPAPDPVDAIRFRMEQQGLTAKDLAPLLGGKSKVSEVLGRKRALSLSMIRRLHGALGIPLEVLVQEGGSAPREAFDPVVWQDFPLAEMVKRRWFGEAVTTARQLLERAEELLGGYLTAPGMPDLRPARLRQAVRRGGVANERALWAWQARVWHLAQGQEAEPFRAEAIDGALIGDVARLSVLEDGPKVARDLLAKAGIRLVFEPPLPKTHLDGAAIRGGDGTVIVALTLRHDRLDNFWFTLCHELAHVVLHLRGDGCRIVVDDLEETGDRPAEELEADRLAADALIDRERWAAFTQRGRVGRADVLALARAERLHPAIVAGRWRRETGDHRAFSDLLGRGRLRASLLPSGPRHLPAN